MDTHLEIITSATNENEVREYLSDARGDDSSEPHIQNHEENYEQHDEENPIQRQEVVDQINEVVKNKWKYVNCSLASMGISITFFGSDLPSRCQLSPLLVEISLLTIFVILGVLFYMIYAKIMQEQQLRLENNEPAVFAGNPYQLFLLALSACLASVVFTFIAIKFGKSKYALN